MLAGVISDDTDTLEYGDKVEEVDITYELGTLDVDSCDIDEGAVEG